MKIVCPSCNTVNNVPQKEHYSKANCGNCKKSFLDGEVAILNQQRFDEFIVNSDIPVIVDFWAPWCGPCKMFAPTFSNIAQQFPLKVAFGKVDTQEEQYLASRFAIRSIPTLIIFKNGKEVERISGALDAQSLTQLCRKYL